MSWDRKARGAAGGYFYESLRLPDKPHPVKRYVGRGAAGHETARGVEARKRDRQAQRKALAAEKGQTADADTLTAELTAWAGALADAWMAKAGHKRHHREWRLTHG